MVMVGNGMAETGIGYISLIDDAHKYIDKPKAKIHQVLVFI